MCCCFQSSDENVNVLYHPPDLEGPILFSYREKLFFGKKKASLRVENGDWSEKFALDAAGSTGVVECNADEVKYEVSDAFLTINIFDLKFHLSELDRRSQHTDAQLAHETNHVYAVLRAAESSAIPASSPRERSARRSMDRVAARGVLSVLAAIGRKASPRESQGQRENFKTIQIHRSSVQLAETG